MADGVKYIDINNHTLMYCLVVCATMGQRQQRWMVTMGGGDGRGAPLLPFMGGTCDTNRWRSCCGGVGAVFLGVSSMPLFHVIPSHDSITKLSLNKNIVT